ncbi:MAG: hypothetical protein ACPGTQ_09805 [Colwellia sp.]
MENQQLVNVNRTDALSHFKLLNKLGAVFFIMFLAGVYLPLADLGGWSNETFNLYSLAEPTFLIVLAVLGVVTYLSGISRVAGRAISALFVALILGWLISQLYDIYDLAKTAREMRGRDFEFKHFIRSFKEITGALPVSARDIVSPAVALLVVSFIGIVGCIFSPRYKENKTLKATLLGQQIPADEVSSSVSQESNNTIETSSAVNNGKNLLSLIITKVVSFIKYAYQIIKPLIDALLDKAADIICKQQPNLKREQVKLALLAIFIVLIFLIFS